MFLLKQLLTNWVKRCECVLDQGERQNIFGCSYRCMYELKYLWNDTVFWVDADVYLLVKVSTYFCVTSKPDPHK